MKILLSVIFILSSATQIFAQYTDSTFYHLNVMATGSLNETNAGDAYLLNNSLNFGVKRKSIVLNTANNWLYGKQNGNLSNNDVNSTLNFNLYKTFPHFYYWGLANYTSSYSLKINHQLQTGLGIAYNIVDKENFYLNISDGILYETSNIFTDSRYDTYRNSLRLQYRWKLKELIVFEGNNFLQNSLSNNQDFIIRSVNKLGIQLRKWISFTTTLNYNRMNLTKSENLNLTYGITIDQYF